MLDRDAVWQLGPPRADGGQQGPQYLLPGAEPRRVLSGRWSAGGASSVRPGPALLQQSDGPPDRCRPEGEDRRRSPPATRAPPPRPARRRPPDPGPARGVRCQRGCNGGDHRGTYGSARVRTDAATPATSPGTTRSARPPPRSVRRRRACWSPPTERTAPPSPRPPRPRPRRPTVGAVAGVVRPERTAPQNLDTSSTGAYGLFRALSGLAGEHCRIVEGRATSQGEGRSMSTDRSATTDAMSPLAGSPA